MVTVGRARMLPPLGMILVAAFALLPLAGLVLYPAHVGGAGIPSDVALRGLDAARLPKVEFAAAAYRIDEDAGPAILTVTLSAAPAVTVTVDYAGSGTATAGADYTGSTGTLTFAPGQVSQSLSVTVIADALDEDDETVVLVLSNPSYATLGTPATATLTIVDDDGPPAVRFDRSSYIVDEEAGTATITVTLSAPSSRIITVSYATGDGTAKAGSDYAATAGTLTFLPPTSLTAEAVLERATNTSLYDPPSPDPAGVAYISHLDMLLISDSEVNEINSDPDLWEGVNLFGTTLSGELIYTVATTGSSWNFSDEPTGVAYDPSNRHLFFSDDTGQRRIYEVDPGRDGAYATVDDTIHSFRTSDFGSTDPEGICYDSWGGTLLIADGGGERIYRIAPGANGVFDGVPASGGDDQVTYVDTHRLNIHDPEGVEFDPYTGHLYISGRRYDPIAETTVDGRLIRYIGISVLAPHKLAGLAYAPPSNGSGPWHLYLVDRGVDNDYDPYENDGRLYEISFPPGETTCTFTVPIVDDDTTEGTETLHLALIAPEHAVLDPEGSHATLEIVDTSPSVQFGAASYEVGEDAGWATIAVTLNAPSGKVVSVGYGTSDGTAVAGNDYVPAAGRLAFAAGVTERLFSVRIIDEGLDEQDETLGLALSDPSNAVLGTPSVATLTIVPKVNRVYLPLVWRNR
jgi:hypothetical protein